MTTRKLYDSEEYRELTRQLESILYQQSTKLDLSSDQYNIQGSTEEQQYFISVREMPLFAELADFDCRTIKLINYGQAAISLAYFTKHKYFVQKKVNPVEVQALLGGIIQELQEQISAHNEAEINRALMEQIDHYRLLHDQVDRHQFAYSNYERHYRYSYLSYKYVNNGKIQSANSHLIKHTRDQAGEILIERTNVIFVDEAALSRPAAYANKQVLEFLSSFPEVVPCGRFDLYIK